MKCESCCVVTSMGHRIYYIKVLSHQTVEFFVQHFQKRFWEGSYLIDSAWDESTNRPIKSPFSSLLNAASIKQKCKGIVGSVVTF